MKTIQLVILLFSCSATGAYFSQIVNETNHQISQIIGGEVASPVEFPWVVELVNNDEHICGGSLIAPQWVVSAGHCGQGMQGFVNPPNKIRVNPFSTSNPQVGTQIIDVEEIFIFPGYDVQNQVYNPDVCLIKLASPVSNPTTISILANSNDLNLIDENDPCSVLGWGSTDANGTQSDFMKIGNIIVINQDFCATAYGFAVNSYEYTHTIHAGYTNEQTQEGAGAGDSGGPLFVMNGDTPLLVGVVSRGMEMVTTVEYPGQYTKLYAVKDWIFNTMGNSASVSELKNELIEVYNTGNYLVIDSKFKSTTSCQYKVIDTKGTLIQSGTLSISLGKNQVELNEIPVSGIYYIEIAHNENLISKKLFFN